MLLYDVVIISRPPFCYQSSFCLQEISLHRLRDMPHTIARRPIICTPVDCHDLGSGGTEAKHQEDIGKLPKAGKINVPSQGDDEVQLNATPGGLRFLCHSVINESFFNGRGGE